MPARSPRAFGPLRTTRYAVNGVGFDMVRVPPGRFIDGEGEDRRELLVSHPFEIGATQVTQALWRAVMNSSPSMFPASDRPVERVSCEDVRAFLGRLTSLGFTGFRLPAEAEWVWAARCGASTRWAGSDRTETVALSQARQTVRVAGLSPSSAGIFDLSGNVWEWQLDEWSGPAVAGVDTQGSGRVNRGGSCHFGTQISRVAARSGNASNVRYYDIGFRLLRTAS